MGVTGLWTVVQPCARPIKIETLNRKRLAVDASLWIYAFLKAVRDKEGNALRNSHVVGFYRRICKLLYIGIQPVFVFDGGAPVLKRQTINGRKQRREGRREDAVRTAGKLLAVQMQRRAVEEDQKRRNAAAVRPSDQDEEEVPDDAVYVEEQLMTQQERQQKQKFKKKDQYHLPDLDMSLAEMGQPNDPRVMSLEDLENYARQFDSGEDINVYDFSKIDFNSHFFQSLPASDRYNILNAARLRSRLRMGLSKDQLDSMFPDRMAFSRFQIERVKERNELTQRLMNLSGMGDDPLFGNNGTGRIAGEKGREYVLVKNAGVEGGWALGVIGDSEEGGRDKPINVDEIGDPAADGKNAVSEDEEDDFEDVPIEGLNRLPKVSRDRQDIEVDTIKTNAAKDVARRRNALYKSREMQSAVAPTEEEDPDSLFVPGAEIEPNHIDSEIPGSENDDEAELQRAIAMSLEIEPNQVQGSEDEDEAELQRAFAMSLENNGRVSSPARSNLDENIQRAEKTREPKTKSIAMGSGYSAPLRTNPFDESDNDSEMEFENVLEARPDPIQLHAQLATGERRTQAKVYEREETASSRPPKFDGPLPFEKLDLGSSILGKKKMKKLEEDSAGGFEKYTQQKEKSKESAALPPWFSADLKTGIDAQNIIEKEYREKSRAAVDSHFEFPEQPKLQKYDSAEVIDVDALADESEVINIESSDDESDDFGVKEDLAVSGAIADMTPTESLVQQQTTNDSKQSPARSQEQQLEKESDEAMYEWEESDREEPGAIVSGDMDEPTRTETGPVKSVSVSRSPSLEFENVSMANIGHGETAETSFPPEMDEEESEQASGIAPKSIPLLDESDDDRYGSDAEDEELLLQMATEVEEHARFASTLNSRSQRQNIEDFERELKQLQTQQKKDRRDADEVTHTMISECQQLLQLFGLPYITAPMEAEAQCAELVSLGLVDGIVTDDSDIFLFGGTRIYKNMFNQSKFVECYLSSDLEREFDLTRDKMIRIAHLLGSDYTEGLPGVGPVTALEIISEFPGGLDEFRDWWALVQMGAKPTPEDGASPFRRKFRRNSTKLFLPSSFPDKRVDQAYLQPDVDSDPSVFQWGVPDLDALRSYLMATVGWTQERTDEVLVPVIRDMNRRETEGTQANITRYISGGVGAGSASLAPRRTGMGKSKRMEGALEKLAERARARRKEEAEAAAADSGRKAGAVGGLASKQDRAVGDDEAVIAVPGTAVRDGSAKKRKAKNNGKRKVAFELGADRAGSDDDDDAVSGEQTVKRKKPKVRGGRKK